MNMNRKRCRHRRGVAAVEAAIVLPVLFLIVLGTIEVTSMIFLRQALVASAYEAGRIAIRRDGSAAAAQFRGEEVLSARNITDGSFVFNPTNIAELPRGQALTVTVTAPANSHSVIPLNYFNGMTLSAQLTFIKE
jgi:Flp pilus assembly protein TadG